MHASIHRIGLAVAGLAVLVAIGGFFVVDGYLSSQRTAALASVSAPVTTAPSTAGVSPSPAPEVVYVRPAPPPKVIHVTRPAPSAPPKVIHVTVPGTGGEHEGGDGAGDGSEND